MITFKRTWSVVEQGIYLIVDHTLTDIQLKTNLYIE
jgi:hypothetical protein